MTAVLPETEVSQQADLLHRLREVLDGHPAGGAFRLLYATDELPVAPGEVLVQTVDADRRVAELRPRAVSDIRPGDILHASQTIDPNDAALGDWASTPTALICAQSYDRAGKLHHNYG